MLFLLSVHCSAREGGGETGARLAGHWGGWAWHSAVPCCVQSLQVSLPTSMGAGQGPAQCAGRLHCPPAGTGFR